MSAMPCMPTNDPVTETVEETTPRQQVIEPNPNDSHPALEFPPLYFVLRDCFPSCLTNADGWIHKWYSWRWTLSYPLLKRIRHNPLLYYFRIYLTYGQVLLALPFAVLLAMAVYYTWWNPSVSITGQISRAFVFAALLLAQKNSYLTLLLGLPFNRAMPYHKLAGYLAVLTGLLHTWAHFQVNYHSPQHSSSSSIIHELLQSNSMNTSGTMMLVFVVGLMVTSLPWIRKVVFQVFYLLHLLMLVGIVVASLFHTGYVVPLFVFCTFGMDMLLRKLFMARYRYPRQVTLRIVSDSVVQLEFPKVAGFDFNPGQYVYLAIPELSAWEWHPFSLSSAPHESVVTIHVRVAGDWTMALHQLAMKKTQVDMLLEGPYGNFAIDVTSPERYKVFMLLSGGIGLTPLQSLLSHLLHEQTEGRRQLKKLKFVWIQRDPELMVQSQVADLSANLHGSKRMMTIEDDEERMMAEEACSTASMEDSECAPSLASRILATIPPSQETDEELDGLYESSDILMFKETLLRSEENEEEDNVVAVPQSYSPKQDAAAQDSFEGMFHFPGMLSSILSSTASTSGSDGTVGPASDALSTGDDASRAGPFVDEERDDANTRSQELQDGVATDDSVSDMSNQQDQDEHMEALTKEVDLEKEAGSTQEPNLTRAGDVVDIDIYLTESRDAPTLHNISGLKFGRPDIAALFAQMRQEAIEQGEKRVAVCVCGPKRIMFLCRKACIELSDRKVRFDFHQESFG